MRWWMNVNQVKNVIKKTECAEHVYSGLFCSEPIMSKDETGEIIDNYLVFSRSDDCSQISPPLCVFGIDTQKEKTKYINDSIPDGFQETLYTEEFVDEEMMKKARAIYLELFPVVRNMYQFNKGIDSSVVQEYVGSLKQISGNTLFGFYEKLFPSFFEWINTL